MSKQQDRGNLAEDDASIGLRLDEQLCFPLYATSRQMTRLYGAFLEPLGLTYPQYLVLLVLWEQSPRTVSEIGTELQLNTNTITPLLKRLEQAGWVERQRRKADERVVEVGLTLAGQKLRAECRTLPVRIVAAVGWEVEKALQLRALLGELNGRLAEAVAGLEAADSERDD